MQEVLVRRLEPLDDRTRFRSGNIDLDRFFLRYAGQNQFRHHIGTTYVAVQGDHITGFVTVSSGEMVAEKLTKVLRRRLFKQAWRHKPGYRVIYRPSRTRTGK